MTAEQEEQWRAAVMPIALAAIGDKYEETAEGMDDSIERFKALNVPGWLTQFRLDLIHLLSDSNSAYLPTLIVRAEAAIVGIQIRANSSQAELEPVYRRVFLRFLHEGLRPLVEWVKQADNQRRRGYKPLITLYEILLDKERFANAWFSELASGGAPTIPEIEQAEELASIIFAEGRRMANSGAKTARQWASADNSLSYLVINSFQAQYSFIKPPVALNGELMAQAFVTALESECPPPDWILSA